MKINWLSVNAMHYTFKLLQLKKPSFKCVEMKKSPWWPLWCTGDKVSPGWWQHRAHMEPALARRRVMAPWTHLAQIGHSHSGLGQPGDTYPTLKQRNYLINMRERWKRFNGVQIWNYWRGALENTYQYKVETHYVHVSASFQGFNVKICHLHRLS